MTSREPGWDLALGKARRARDLLGLGALALVALGTLLAVWLLLRGGFSHVSDDDFARTVIAQEWVASVRGWPFLHELAAPRDARWVRVVDPSGTSWLPLPFWLTGAAMSVFGRSIEVARVTQMMLLAGAAALLTRSLRRGGFSRFTAACILGLGLANPTMLWAAGSQTPDAWVAALIAVGLVALAEERPDGIAAACLLAASLSRYEAWPVAAVFVLRHAARRRLAPRDRVRACLPALGPLAWMAWNAYAHGSALHFFARVARYRTAHEPLALTERLAFVPSATLDLLGGLLAAAFGAAALVVMTTPSARRRWWAPVAGALALLAFLVAGSLGDGAPTHHAGRPQLALSWLGAVLLVVGIQHALHRLHERWGSKAGAVLVAVLCFAGVSWGAALPSRTREWPGRGDAARTEQIAQGRALRGHDTITLVPCQYEHLAVLAAFTAPERVVVLPAGAFPPGVCPAFH